MSDTPLEDGSPIGFIGLGDMGLPMASNLASGLPGVGLSGDAAVLNVFDLRKPADLPANMSWCEGVEAVAAQSRVVFMSVPDAAASRAVLQALAGCSDMQMQAVINLSTVGVAEARSLNDYCASELTNRHGNHPEYIDAPVSGGKAGATKGTITIIWGGARSYFDSLQPLLETFSKSRFFVGPDAGQGQVVKLLNNFLSGVAMAATSEAVRFGLHHEVDMKTILDVVHVSTGQNMAVSDKFPNRILTGSFDAGFRMELMHKDLNLYHTEAQRENIPTAMADQAVQYFEKGREQFPDGDFTEIFKVVE